jgi:hypothetical protein
MGTFYSPRVKCFLKHSKSISYKATWGRSCRACTGNNIFDISHFFFFFIVCFGKAECRMSDIEDRIEVKRTKNVSRESARRKRKPKEVELQIVKALPYPQWGSF